jgi:hypothetical protein
MAWVAPTYTNRAKLSRNLPERVWRAKKTKAFFAAVRCCGTNAGTFGVGFACGASIRSGDIIAR